VARSQSRFICQRCAESFLRWEGQCRACGEWNSLVETIVREPSRTERSVAGGIAGAAQPSGLADISEVDLPRLTLGIGELDRVLGGGLVPGSLVLLGGEPGIGKSTLLLQAAAGLARTDTGASCMRPGRNRPVKSGCGPRV
jgi:DNA repair protein RadA/Sms